MFSISKFSCIGILVIIFLVNPTFSQQFYHKSSCSSESPVNGSNYICSFNNQNCHTYIVYRAQNDFNTYPSIASLFNLNQSDLLAVNRLTKDDSSILSIGREVVIPITCHCLDGFSQAFVRYNFTSKDSVSSVACGVFEGLVKAQNLLEKNPDLGGYNISDGHLINVTIRCACAEPNQINSSVIDYLVTYPIIEGDNTDLIARKFKMPEKLIRDANGLAPYSAIFPQTTLLVPTKNVHDVNWNIGSAPKVSPAPEGVIPLRKFVPGEESSIWDSHLLLGLGVGFPVVTLLVVACGVFSFIHRKNHPNDFKALSAGTLPSSKLSPDLLDGVSKLKNTLIDYRLEEITAAAQNFNETSMISPKMYKGKFGALFLAIEEMDSEEAARNVVYILTKINHLNIVRLDGICFESNNYYIVFEFAERGSLWDCLSNVELDRQFTWARRLQIAFDLAAALHYLHNSTRPAFVHNNITSKNVLITIDWRAKISGFSLAKAVTNGEVCLKMDVFAFGVVLLQLISGKEFVSNSNGKVVMDSVNLLLVDYGIEDSTLFLEKLRGFIDPILKGDYHLGEAICLLLLAKSCIEDEPDLRPTMNDIVIALSRIIQPSNLFIFPSSF